MRGLWAWTAHLLILIAADGYCTAGAAAADLPTMPAAVEIDTRRVAPMRDPVVLKARTTPVADEPSAAGAARDSDPASEPEPSGGLGRPWRGFGLQLDPGRFAPR